MGDQIGAIILGLGSATAAVLGAVALLLRARSSAGKPARLLERLWDWVEGQDDLVDQVPPTLRTAIQQELAPDDTEGS